MELRLPDTAIGNGMLDIFKNSRDKRRIFLYIRGHDDYVPQLQLRIVVQKDAEDDPSRRLFP